MKRLTPNQKIRLIEIVRGTSISKEMKTLLKGCKFDTDGDGNCHIHPKGCK